MRFKTQIPFLLCLYAPYPSKVVTLYTTLIVYSVLLGDPMSSDSTPPQGTRTKPWKCSVSIVGPALASCEPHAEGLECPRAIVLVEGVL